MVLPTGKYASIFTFPVEPDRETPIPAVSAVTMPLRPAPFPR